jgi:hypothetical protein
MNNQVAALPQSRNNKASVPICHIAIRARTLSDSGVGRDGTLLNHAWLTQPLCDQNGNEDTEEETGEDTERCGEAEG